MTDLNTTLILKIESSVQNTNIEDFKTKSDEYLKSLTTKFETDDDFAQAAQEIKDLKSLEDATKKALDEAVNGSADVSKLIVAATAIVEQFRDARLEREKLVKAEKEAKKKSIIDVLIAEVASLYDGVSPISEAFAIRMPQSVQNQRIHDATKRRQTIDSLTKAVNAELANIKAEMMTTVKDLNERLALIPDDKMHLFNDAQQLIAGDADINMIIDIRIKAENARLTESQSQPVEQPATRITPVNTSDIVKPAEPVEQDEDEVGVFRLTIDGVEFITKDVQLSKVVTISKTIKEQFESVSLKKLKEKNHE